MENRNNQENSSGVQRISQLRRYDILSMKILGMILFDEKQDSIYHYLRNQWEPR